MIDKLEMLLASARKQHFGRAVEACGITQPMLFAGLKRLEEGFGVLLVHRRSRFLGFTPEGQRVLDWARRIVGDACAMHQELRALKHGLAEHLRALIIGSVAPGVVYTILAHFDDREVHLDPPVREAMARLRVPAAS